MDKFQFFLLETVLWHLYEFFTSSSLKSKCQILVQNSIQKTSLLSFYTYCVKVTSKGDITLAKLFIQKTFEALPDAEFYGLPRGISCF